MPFEVIDVTEVHADYLRDESRRKGRAEKIGFPRSAADVVEALKIAAANEWRVTAQGGRTGVTGGCVPDGGLILNLSRMSALGEIRGDLMTVQPGAPLADIRSALENSGLFFPSDLTETTASIGGMVSNNASGARSFKYGAVRNWIHALEVALPNGELVTLERGVHKADGMTFEIGAVRGRNSHFHRCDRRVKSAAGYFVEPDMDLVDLFIGAEGTLGVVTEITIKLLPRPESMSGVTAFFENEAAALAFVRFLRDGFDPVAIEFFDSKALDLLRRVKTENPAFAELPELNREYHTALYFEFDQEIPAAVIERAEAAVECWLAEGEREIAKLKAFRHAIPEAVNRLIAERGLTKLGTDMSVPDDRLEDVMAMYHEGLAAAGLDYVIFGHAGNNHVHVNILPRDAAEHARGEALYLEWAKQVVRWGGSISAEHGVGKIKPAFLALMLGEDGVAEMKKLKARFDPRGALNAGNLFSISK